MKRYFTFIILCLFISCSQQDNMWKEVSTKNSIYAYQEYIKEYPRGKYLANAKDSIEYIEWITAKYSNNIETVQNFLDKYQKSKFLIDAKILLEKVKYTPSRTTIENCMVLATKTYFGNPNSSVQTVPTIKKIYEYDKKLGYMRVDGACVTITNNNSQYYAIPKYYKLTTDGKGKWSAMYIE